MYKLGNVQVSGSHKVLFEKEWIFVRDHKDAIKINNFQDKYIYCLNTSKKIIYAGDYTFQDWDELDKSSVFKYGCQSEEDIHEKLDNGFHESTEIYIKNKGNVLIKDVEIGDVLQSEERVVGTVMIQNDKPLYEYKSGFLGTKQLSVIQNLGKKSRSLF